MYKKKNKKKKAKIFWFDNQINSIIRTLVSSFIWYELYDVLLQMNVSKIKEYKKVEKRREEIT